MSRPTPAERARTTVRLSPYLRVRMPGATAEVDLHGTDPDGSVVLVVPEESPVVAAVRRATADVPVLVDAADLCPVPVADRVRTRVRLVGWVHEPAPELRRELALVAADRDGAEALLDIGNGRTVLYVDVVEAHVAAPGTDPDDVGAVDVVRHQDYAGARPDPLSGTEAALLGHLVPVALDRYGLVLRCGGQDVRLPFGAPVGCPRELPARMRELLSRTGVPARRG